jgi:Tol biopolymer transport system component
VRARGLLPLSLALACATAPNPSAPASAAETPTETPAEAEAQSTASQAPDTEIHLADLDLQASPPTVSNLRNATAREGYDNQPFFADGSREFFYTSIRDGQADIYAYDLASGQSRRVHHHPANEYSPTLMPGGAGISMIREDAGVQKLWHVSPTGDDLGPVLPDVVDVGYHAWLSPTDVALFVLDTEAGRHRLEIVHLPDQTRKPIAENIGRCMAVYPRSLEPTGAITYVALADDESAPHRILRYDLETGQSAELLQTRPGSQDYAWAPDGSLLMVEDTDLYRWTKRRGWQRLAELAEPGSVEITRLAVSEDGKQLAFVVGPVPEE